MDSPNGKPWCATEEGVIDIEGPSGGSKSNWDYCNENCGKFGNNINFKCTVIIEELKIAQFVKYSH